MLRSVVFEAQTHIGEVGSDHVRRCLFVGLCEAKCGPVLPKNRVSFLGVPGRVTHFEGETESWRAKSEKILE